MMLVDKRLLASGIAMMAVGIALTVSLSASSPVGHSGMTDDEALDLIVAQQEIQDYNTLAGILIAVGFLLALISFGARRRGSAKKVAKKPAE